VRESAKAIKLANDLRKDLELEERFLDLPPLLEDMGLDLRCEPLPAGIEGLTRDSQIVIAPDHPERRRRFTVAHEVGHHLLGHGRVSCSGGSIHGRVADPKEEEANTFAASLLMPAKLFRKDAARVHPRFCEIDQLADDYGVSLTAASIRYVKFTRDLCALIGARPPESPWLIKSWSRGWYLALPPGEETLVHSCQSGDAEARSAEISARAWFENYPWERETTIREEVVQTTDSCWLALLSEIPDYDDDPDRDEREALAELDRRRRSFRRG